MSCITVATIHFGSGGRWADASRSCHVYCDNAIATNGTMNQKPTTLYKGRNNYSCFSTIIPSQHDYMNPNSIIQATQSTETVDPATLAATLPAPALSLSGATFTFKATIPPNSEPKSLSCVTEHSAPAPVSSGFAALSNEDILGLIFQQLDAFFCGEDLKMRNQSLLWAAQTSKAFFRPAVSALWRTIRSLVPLLKILPQFKTSNSVHVS